MRLGHGLLRLWRPLYVSTLAAALAATFAAAFPAAARAASALTAASLAATLAAAALAAALAAPVLAAADVVHQYVRARSEPSVPGRWPWLPDCSVWRSGSVRHRHGLRRLRRALHVPAVSASAIALTAASLVASAPDVVRRLVHPRD